MTSLSRTAQAKLAAEIQANLPAPEWDSVAELSPKKWKEEIELKDGKKRLTFGEMAELSIKLKSEIDYREKIQKEIKTHLMAGLLTADKEEVVYEGHAVQLVTRKGSRKIVPEKLLENGVSAAQIAAATEVGAESTFVQIGRPKKDY